MLRKLILTLSVSTFLLIVPILEISETHVFNPLWPSHARLHEVWQLSTNAGLGLLSLWLAWRTRQLRIASALGLLVTLGFLAAFLLSDSYGGSMQHTDGTELRLLGVNASVLVMLMASAGLVFSFTTSRPGPPKSALSR